MSGPLEGLRVVEFAGIGPCPFAAMLLADLGATVVRIERHSLVDVEPTVATFDVMQRGKVSIGVDLKSEGGVAFALDLIATCDVLLEGFRPGVMERLGLGPTPCLERNELLIYGRMTGWGQDGPLAPRAGHDINYVALSGALSAIGRKGERPVPPLNLVGDFGGGGMLLALGVVAALHALTRIGRGQVIDAAMIDGAALLTTMFYGLRAEGAWSDERGTNRLDSGAAFYEVYECADGEMIAVGALEPQFFAELMDILAISDVELDAEGLVPQASWPELKSRFTATFLQRTREEWLHRADGRDACLTPVLTMKDAPEHPHAKSRSAFVEIGGVLQPAPAPRFSVSTTEAPSAPQPPGGGGRATVLNWGISPGNLERLVSTGVVSAR